MKRNFIFFLSLFAFQILWAEPNAVHDPKNVLAQVDKFLGSQSFESSLVCESKARYFAPVRVADLGCDEYSCWSAYQTQDTAEGNMEVHNCSPESVSIYSDDGRAWDISKAAFEAAHGNMLRLFLPTLGDFFGYAGEVTLEKATPAQYTLASGAKLEAMNVEGKFRLAGMKPSYSLLLTVVKSTPGVAQIARVRLENQSWLRLKEF